ncbi:membrane protease YdiL (CAAX protease family) [Bacillus mesophilus]|uniref:CPBP family intramembrane metalloprotease n=1 Tax=Bacillus mesophilus TaxID=1808955 RepID=A0A6M0Q333_9BACI|nr:CPBP family intramembrane glutamic endopeptidase [Bacillus mesophilus]MBM7659897.1 membrane protease YdiL (CAAX protease family) [Bacillus mesophilus]NEY70756.1 CPBP family intramembrane metalloprotease [Bacillus mesophilus]
MKILKATQSFLKKHPFIFAFFALILSRIAGMASIELVQLFRPDLTIADDLGWLLMMVYAGVVVTLVYWTDLADEIGLRKPKHPKEWLTIIPLLLLPLFIIMEKGIYSWGFSINLVLIIAAIGVAINEEVLFRGILLRGFMKWGPWVAIFVPSALFGLIHSTNIFVGGDPTFAIFQTIWTFAAGVILSAIRLRTNSLYPVIVFHIILDGVEYFSTGEYGVHSDPISLHSLTLFASITVVLAVYAIILFHKSNKNSSTTDNLSV